MKSLIDLDNQELFDNIHCPEVVPVFDSNKGTINEALLYQKLPVKQGEDYLRDKNWNPKKMLGKSLYNYGLRELKKNKNRMNSFSVCRVDNIYFRICFYKYWK